MKRYFVFALLPTILLLAGCQGQNRFSTHGSEIMQYQGDEDVLKNCCSAAMALLADDIKQKRQLDSYPVIHEKAVGWTKTTKGLININTRARAWRMTLTCDDEDQQYRLEVAWVKHRPAIITIDKPDGDDALVNHLKKLFSNFDVKCVSAL
jgi:hypothetical protein